MSPMTSKNVQNVAENGTKVNYFQSPRFLFIIGHWSMNQTYYCETRFWKSHDVLCWQVMDSPGMFTNNIGYKSVVRVFIDRVLTRSASPSWPSPLTQTITHHFHINTPSRHLSSQYCEPELETLASTFTRLARHETQNSCIVCWRFCLRLVIEEILWMEVSGV